MSLGLKQRTLTIWGGTHMSLTTDEVRKVADLAKLEFDDGELAPLARELSSILEMVEQMAQAETDEVEPLAHPNPFAQSQRLREDNVTEGDLRDRFQTIAPRVSDGLYLVPKVIDN